MLWRGDTEYEEIGKRILDISEWEEGGRDYGEEKGVDINEVIYSHVGKRNEWQ